MIIERAVTNPALKRQAESLAVALARSNGTTATANAVEKLAANAPPSPPADHRIAPALPTGRAVRCSPPGVDDAILFASTDETSSSSATPK